MFITLAVHHPKPEHADDFVAFMKKIEAAMEGTPGLVSIESFRDAQSPSLVAIGRWESPEAAQAGLPKLMAVGGRDADWSRHQDDLFLLTPA